MVYTGVGLSSALDSLLIFFSKKYLSADLVECSFFSHKMIILVTSKALFISSFRGSFEFDLQDA